MKSKIHKVLFVLFCTGLLAQSSGIAQNLVANADFEEASGSFNQWTTASGTTLSLEGTDHYATLAGENGVLLQKISTITAGSLYTCTFYFKSIKSKQTTGYGFAIETDVTLSLPTFTVGASNLKSFCESNNGQWITLPADVPEQNVSKAITIQLPSNASAIYVCTGTKGAIAELKIDSITLFAPKLTEVEIQVKNKKNDAPIENAEIQIDGITGILYTNVDGKAFVNVPELSNTYSYTVAKDWFKKASSSFTVSENTPISVVLLDSIEEVKKVVTRISKYGDNATPYPLFGHLWNSNLAYNTAQINTLTSALDYIVGGGGVEKNAGISNKLHAANPDFQIILYQGGWTQNASAVEDKKTELQYYRCGTLRTNIDESSTSFSISAPTDNKGLGLLASEPGKFTTWIRIGNELIKVVSVSSTSNYPITVTVERGLDSSIATAHTSGSTVTAPLYGTAPVPGGDNSKLSYFTTVFGSRKALLKENILDGLTNYNLDGIWIDILVGWLDAKSMLGTNYTLWNHKTEKVLSSSEIISYTKDALNDLYNETYARIGYFPTIYGNNVLYSTTLNSADRGYLMVKNQTYPRGLDGFCHENSWGHMNDSENNIDNDGDPIQSADKFISVGQNDRYLEWYMGDTWIKNNKAIALLAQNNLPNQPMTINAGYKNQWFASDLTDEIRYNFNKYAYVSYLLCVDVKPDSSISCRMGISPMVNNGSTLDVNIEPFFYYPIGVPTQKNAYNNFTNYRVGSHNLFARTFSNGVVLVNPYATDMTTPVTVASITGVDNLFTNPEDETFVSSVMLKSRESLILIKTDSIPTNTASTKTETARFNVYPNPVNNMLTINLKESTRINHNVEIYSAVGLVQKTTLHFNAKTLDVSALNAGVYFIRIEGITGVKKFIKR